MYVSYHQSFCFIDFFNYISSVQYDSIFNY